MMKASFVFTILFMLLGPIKIIPGFLKLTQGAPRSFKREVAIKAALIASAIVAVVSLLGTNMLAKYGISLDGLRLAGGLVLLISALKLTFPDPEQSSTDGPMPTALQLAISPVALPLIVPPAGIAAVLIFTTLASTTPGMNAVVAQVLVALMALDFLVMFFIDPIVRLPGVLLVLNVFGAILVFIQIALALELLVIAFRGLGVVR